MEMKIVDRRSGDLSHREIWLAKAKKQGANFVEMPVTYFWVFSLSVVVSLTLKLVKNVWSIMKEKASGKDLPTALISSREG